MNETQASEIAGAILAETQSFIALCRESKPALAGAESLLPVAIMAAGTAELKAIQPKLYRDHEQMITMVVASARIPLQSMQDITRRLAQGLAARINREPWMSAQGGPLYCGGNPIGTDLGLQFGAGAKGQRVGLILGIQSDTIGSRKDEIYAEIMKHLEHKRLEEAQASQPVKAEPELAKA